MSDRDAAFSNTDIGETTAGVAADLNKNGMNRWQSRYYSAFKDQGMTNQQAINALASGMATPGGLGGLKGAYDNGYSFGGPMGTYGDTMEKGIASQLPDIIGMLQAAKIRNDWEKQDALDQAEPPGFWASLGQMGKNAINTLTDLTSIKSPLDEFTITAHQY